MDSEPPAEWFLRPPAAFDIVSARFPEKNPQPDGSFKLRPALVLTVLRDDSDGMVAARVAYGTSNLKLMQREGQDLIIQNAADLRVIGLPRATRFDLDEVLVMPWCPPHFDCWTGYESPVIGSLTGEYAREVAWLMLKRQQPQG